MGILKPKIQARGGTTHFSESKDVLTASSKSHRCYKLGTLSGDRRLVTVNIDDLLGKGFGSLLGQISVRNRSRSASVFFRNASRRCDSVFVTVIRYQTMDWNFISGREFNC